jgi:uncharacterized protein YggE
MNPVQTSLIIAASVLIWSIILGTNISHIWPNAGVDKTITVQWEGKSSLIPNIYSFSITANETGATTKIVSESLAQQLDQAQKVLDTYKIDKKDIQSSNIDIQPNREYDGTKSIEKWYRGTHTLTIKIRTIADAGKIIDSLTTINKLLINGGSYTNDDESSTLEIARKNAFDNAKSKAEELAKLSNMTLGKPISINENISNNTPYPIYKTMAMDSVAESTPSTTINPGEQELQVQLNIVFEMK